MPAMTFASALLEKIPRTSDIASYRFSRPSEYTFSAGQWFTITIPSPAGPLEHQFSHADSPTEGFVELTTRLTGSPFKNALDSLPPGSEVKLRGPYGHFLFEYEAPKIALLTGGVGVTPMRSMLRYLADTGGAGRIEGQELAMFYGCMTEDGIVYREELDDLARAISDLRVVYVITNPTESWTGHRGFITADTLRAELDDPASWTYFISGPPPMISAMQKVMDQLAVPTAQIVAESFAGYSS